MSDTAEIVMEQETLAGGVQAVETVVENRGRPETMLWCHDCGSWILRSRRYDHDHPLFERKADVVTDDDTSTDDADEDEEPERVGGVYDITLSYTVDYQFRVPAHSEHEATDRAKELVYDATPVIHDHVHTRRREVSEIMSDDPEVPDEWDPYGGTPLFEAYGEGDDDE